MSKKQPKIVRKTANGDNKAPSEKPKPKEKQVPYCGYGKGLVKYAEVTDVETIANNICGDTHDCVMKAAIMANEQLNFEAHNKLIQVAEMLGLEDYGKISIKSVKEPEEEADPYTNKLKLTFSNTKKEFVNFVKKFVKKQGHEVEAKGDSYTYLLKPEDAEKIAAKLAEVEGVKVALTETTITDK